MKPGEHLITNFIQTPDALAEESRREQLRRAIVDLDESVDKLPAAPIAAPLAQRLASGIIRSDEELDGWFAKGRVRDVRVLPPHDHYMPNENPGTLVISQLVRVRVEHQRLFSRRPPQVVGFYALSLWSDMAANHIKQNGRQESLVAEPDDIELDPKRGKLMPPAQTFRFGLASYDNTVHVFGLGESGLWQGDSNYTARYTALRG